jgi:hypothetical protein
MRQNESYTREYFHYNRCRLLGKYVERYRENKNFAHERHKIPVVGWLDRSIPAATATATPSAMSAAIAGAIAASVTTTAAAAAVVAALSGGVPLPAMPVPSMLGIEAAAITHPCLLVKKDLNQHCRRSNRTKVNIVGG